MSICKYCGKSTPNRLYCNRSCAAKVNNVKGKRKCLPLPACKVCGNTVVYRYNKFCKSCCDRRLNYVKAGTTPISERTLEQAIELQKHSKGANRYNSIRGAALIIYKKELDVAQCNNCGYNKHVQVCHKIPISNFPPTALVKDINARSNIVFLCPNCHWEFDHGLLNYPPSWA